MIDVNPNHSRGIATTLCILDEALCAFAAWAEGREVRSVLYCENNDLTLAQRQDILKEINDLKTLISQMKDHLKITSAPQNVAQAIWGRCAALWVDLIKLNSKHLRRYGEPSEALATYIDPKADMLMEKLNRIFSIVSSHSRDN